MTFKSTCFSNGQRYIYLTFISLNVAVLIFIRVSYIYLLKCEENSNVINKQEYSKEDEWKEMTYMSQKRMLQVFDYGPQFEASYSPLYKKSTLVKNTTRWTFYPEKRVTDVDCSQLFEQNPRIIENVIKTNVSELSSVCLKSKDCEDFITTRGYIMDPLSDEEANFPIAFSILVYKTPDQFEILLRAIYRPQNVYCVHIDNKTTGSDLKEFECITRCFPNVFLTTNRVEVTWGKIGVLSAELSCMKDLLSFKKWKYFINLTGQEFPLRTNYELVQILKIYNGSNDGEGTIKRANKDRWEKAGAAPHGINPVKGSVHVTLKRKFVEYVINSRIAKDFLIWVNKTDIPDETYFATLIHNPQLGIPGSFKGQLETDFGENKPFLSRFKNWHGAPNSWPCHGKYVRSICIFGLKDLPLLARRPEFFANKFHFDFHGQALLCMDELIFNRTREEYYDKITFDTHYYANLKHIHNVVKV